MPLALIACGRNAKYSTWIPTARSLPRREHARRRCSRVSFWTQRIRLASLPSRKTLVERAEAARGELQALRHEAEAAGFARHAADRRRIPEPEVVAGSK